MSEISSTDIKDKDKSIESEKDDKDILSIAFERYKKAEEGWRDVRDKALKDEEFAIGNQWPQDILRKREVEKRPAITINKIPTFIRQITNEMRQNKPSCKVYPVDDKGDIDTAKVLQGMIRNIEYSSNADIAYVKAGEGAVRKSFGWFRLLSDYVSPESFDQELKIEPIDNDFNVLIDPSSNKIDGSDMQFAFIFDDIPKDEFAAQFPDVDETGTSFGNLNGIVSSWISERTIRVAEYFYRESKKIKTYLVKLPDSEEMISMSEEIYQKNVSKGITLEVLKVRNALKPTVKWCKIAGDKIIEKKDWAGSYIPLFPVFGARVNVNGRVEIESLHRHSQDSQRMVNYMASNEAEAIALSPKAPWIVPEEAIPPEYQDIWRTANSESHAFLPYRHVDENGNPINAPTRNVYDPAVAAITNARMIANDDIKSTTGIFDASLGAKAQETSGIAIQRRNAQSQTSNYHFQDNLAKAIQHCGRCMVELIPIVYDNARIARIIGEDGHQDLIPINQEFQEAGETKMHNLSYGKYDVVVEVGPSYETKRQEAAANMLDMVNHYPQLMQVAGDLLLKNMDWPQADELAERFKKTLAPGLADDNKDQKQVPPEVQQMLLQLQSQNQQLSMQLQQATTVIQTKSVELESKERIEMAKLQQQLTIEMAKLDSKEAVTILQEEIAHINARMGLLDFGQDFDEEIKEDLNEPVGNEANEAQNNQQGIEQ
jgi:Phage P22-like portal protein